MTNPCGCLWQDNTLDDLEETFHATEEREELLISKELLRTDADFRRRAKAGDVDVCEESPDER